MPRRMRTILLFVMLVAPVAPARGDDATLTDIARRVTAAEPAAADVDAPAAADLSKENLPAVESQPLGPPEPAADKLVTRTGGGAIDSSGSTLFDTLTALGVVIGLALLGRWLYTRFTGRTGASRTSPVVEVLARTSVAPRNHVLLLRVGSRILVVSDSPGGMRTLSDIDDPEEVASLIGAVSAAHDSSLTRNFTRMLQGFNGQYDRTRPDDEGGDDHEHTLDRARDSISSLIARVRLLGDRGGAA